MDRRAMFKGRPGAGSQKDKRIAISQKERSQKRQNLHLFGRELAVSPRKHNEPLREAKENNKRDLYSARYLEWKKKKQQQKLQEKSSQKKPFLTVISSNSKHGGGGVSNTNFGFSKEASLKMKIPLNSTSGNSMPKLPKKPNSISVTPKSKSGGNKENEGKIKKLNYPNVVEKINNSSPEFVTSTQRKSSQKLSPSEILNVTFDGISPIEFSLGEDNEKQKIKSPQKNETEPESKSKTKQLRKTCFVFAPTVGKSSTDFKQKIIYTPKPKALQSKEFKLKTPILQTKSIANKPRTPIMETTLQTSHAKKTLPLKIDGSPKDTLENVNNGLNLNVTPNNVFENPLNTSYLSPFVTTSRGKGSAKKERAKRESIYKLNMSCSEDEPVEVRRQRETIKYFRKLLNDEIQRLNLVCNTWHQYRLDNLTDIGDNGSDMITATIGQTRLLTSSKFEQFRGLVDQCERYISNEKDNLVFQVVLPEDLEGFWQMMKLQVENVDLRFQNLEKWKINHWLDPDENKPKIKNKNLTRVAKAKGRKKSAMASNAIRELVKRAHQAYQLESQATKNQDPEIDIAIAKKPMRISGRLSTSKSKQTSFASPKSSPLIKIRRSVGGDRHLLKAAIKKRTSLGMTKLSPRNNLIETPSRKSILKTPGTKKKNKSVIFNEEIQFKSPDVASTSSFTVQDASIDLKHTQRSLWLRSRQVVLQHVDDDYS